MNYSVLAYGGRTGRKTKGMIIRKVGAVSGEGHLVGEGSRKLQILSSFTWGYITQVFAFDYSLNYTYIFTALFCTYLIKHFKIKKQNCMPTYKNDMSSIITTMYKYAHEKQTE